MAESQLTLNADERQCLVDLLSTALKETRVEEHRTRTPAYREHVLKREGLIEGLLSKVRDDADRKTA